MQHFNAWKNNIMLSKAQLKLIKSLEQKKFRKESGLFVAEGGKTVGDLLACGLECKLIIADKEWMESNTLPTKHKITEVSSDDIKKASFLRTPQGILALFRIPQYPTSNEHPAKELCLALDNVQDPGNMGTIIRIADWFGIEHIYCNTGSADAYSPKTVQATMGAIGRVKIHYTDLPAFIASLDKATPVYGTFLNGDNIYERSLSGHGLVVMGNEGNGISKECESLINERLFIPNYPAGRATSESLNVSTATAIICSEFRRRKI